MDQKASQYETIWNAEDGDHEFLSETDVDESQEKQWRCEEGSTNKWARPRGILSTLRTYRWMIDTSLLVVITGLLLVLVLRGPKQSETRQVGGDITAPNRQSEHPHLHPGGLRTASYTPEANTASLDNRYKMECR